MSSANTYNSMILQKVESCNCILIYLLITAFTVINLGGSRGFIKVAIACETPYLATFDRSSCGIFKTSSDRPNINLQV